MAASGLKITFDHISRHFRSIRNFSFFGIFFSKLPFWMTKKHFQSHFSSFQINMQPFCMTENHGHFGSRFLSKSIGIVLYSRSVATSNMKLIGAFLIKLWSAQAFSSYFHKMAAAILFFPIISKIDRVVLPL